MRKAPVLGLLTVALMTAQSPAFEVASVKLSKGPFMSPSFPLDASDAYKPAGGRFTADFPLTVYISFAYKLSLTPEQRQAMMARLPKWVATDSYRIEAKAPTANPTKDEMRAMMRTLLTERFGLVAHFEAQEVPLFALTLVKPGKHGPAIRPHAEGPPCDVAVGPEVFPNICDVRALEQTADRRNRAGSRNITMDLIAASLSGLGQLGRPVVDRTGIEGRVDYTLEWTPDQPATPAAGPAPELRETSFFDALREQLGMKLEPTRGPLQVLVIDKVDRPSEN
jgi:uncharacterized protein (TIGR03435 family)